MTVKSIIEIDVKDEAFVEFQKVFTKYQEALRSMPGEWAKIGAKTEEAQKKTSDGFLDSVAALGVIHGELANINKSLAGGITHARSTGSAFRDIAATTGRISKNVANTTFQLLKWVALGGALGAATGFFGAGALANAGSNLRRNAGGLAVTPGELRAANLNFGKYFDAQGVLGAIGSAQTDIQSQGLLGQLGITGDKLRASPASLLPEILPQLLKVYQQGPNGPFAYQARGFDQIIGSQDIRRLSNLPKGELQETLKSYKEDQARVGINDSFLVQLQKLQHQLGLAGDEIENVFLKILAKLAPHISDLSAAIVKAIETFAKNDTLGKWLDDFGSGLEKVAKYMASAEFATDINSFISGLNAIAKAVIRVGRWFGSDDSDITKEAGPIPPKPPARELSPFEKERQASKQQRIGQLEGQYGLPRGMLDSIWNMESTRGLGKLVSPAGALGEFQFMPGTGGDWGLKSHGDFFDFNKESDAAARYAAYLLKHYGGDRRKAIAAYNRGLGNIDKSGPNWETDLPKETRDYLRKDAANQAAQNGGLMKSSAMNIRNPGQNVTVTVRDITGGSVNINSSQLGIA